MIISELKNNIYALSLSIPEMRFEGMWDLPHGVTLNSYILKGDKLAIIDGAIGWNGSEDSIFTGMKRLDIDPNDVDYLIVNHMEPDHSGWISEFKKYNDHFKVITTLKGSQMVKAFYGEDVNIMIVKEGDSLDLGKNLLLTFHPVPNVHWPETMYTFENNSKTLFSCDMFGAFGILDTSIFYDELSNEETKIFELETIRYFSNVLTTFSSMVEKAIRKAEDLNVETIA
ncbi:MAG: FprA family A-type flavoprotein, partial [Candidatus Izemoplasmatales bacterium]